MIVHSRPYIDQADCDAVLQVLNSGHLEDGENVRSLERAMASRLGRKHGIGVTNGFAAVHLALVALGVKPGDQVIMPSYACSALCNPVRLLGAEPVVVDIEKNGFNIDVDGVKNAISPVTKAIIVPHIFGHPARIDELKDLQIPIIEDCAQSLGGRYKGIELGGFGDISIFSFYATKVIAGGDGGLILTDNDRLAETIGDYRYYGHKKLHRTNAYNYHLTNLPAALARSQLNKLDSFLTKRKEIAQEYDQLLSYYLPNLTNQFVGKEDSMHYRYIVQLEISPSDVRSQLFDRKIGSGFGVLDGIHQILSLDPLNYPRTEMMLQSVLSLPIHPSLKKGDTEKVVRALKEVLKK